MNIKSKLQFIPIAIINTTAYVPYILLLLVGKSLFTGLNAFLPMLLFYIFRYTGTFLLASFYYFESTTAAAMLKKMLLGSAIACLIAMLSPFNSNFLLIAAILLGICSSIQSPLYSTVLLHQKDEKKETNTIKEGLLSLLSLILIVPFFILLTINSLAIYAALFYAILYFLSYILLESGPNYSVNQTQSGGIHWDFLLLFIITTALISFVKTTQFNLQNNLVVLVLIFALSFLVLIPALSKKIKLRGYFETEIYYIIGINGAIGNLFFIYATAYSLALQNYVFLIMQVYLSYFIGMLLSLALSPVFIKKVRRTHQIQVLLGLTLLSLFWINFGPLLFLAGISIGFCSVTLTKQINIHVYYNAKQSADLAILIVNRWSKIGSVFNQVFSLIILLVITFWLKLADAPIFSILAGHTTNHQVPIDRILQLTIVITSICYAVALIFWYYKYQFARPHDILNSPEK